MRAALRSGIAALLALGLVSRAAADPAGSVDMPSDMRGSGAAPDDEISSPARHRFRAGESLSASDSHAAIRAIGSAGSRAK